MNQQDISSILDGWDFDPHELNVRFIQGEDGTEKIQMRIDLGLLQMSVDGRPDATRPHDREFALDHFLDEARTHGNGYRIPAEGLEELFREGWQVYHRYLCLFHLGRYLSVVRDTEQNLRLFEFVRKHAKRRREVWRFDQYRPYVLLMRTRAKGMLSLEEGNSSQAIAEVQTGQAEILEFLEYHGKSDQAADCFELEYLKRWQEELVSDPAGLPALPTRSTSEADRLRSDLQKAIAAENYEHAAVLRDRIRKLDSTVEGPGLAGAP